MTRLTATVFVPVKVEFVIFDNREIPEVGTITTPKEKAIMDSIVIVKHEESLNYPYYRLVGTIGEYTILQSHDL